MIDLSQVPTEELLVELRRRSDAAEPDATVLAREILTTAANAAGLPPPRDQDHGLMEWADELFDSALGRGSDTWREAHECSMGALEAALEGDKALAVACLYAAKNILGRSGRVACVCPGLAIKDAHGRQICTSCQGRKP